MVVSRRGASARAPRVSSRVDEPGRILIGDCIAEMARLLHDRDVMVTSCGRICMYRKRVNISSVLAGQRLGIKEVDDGIWLVSFMSYDLGFIDLEQKTLQPLDNPFGPRLSPMS